MPEFDLSTFINIFKTEKEIQSGLKDGLANQPVLLNYDTMILHRKLGNFDLLWKNYGPMKKTMERQ